MIKILNEDNNEIKTDNIIELYNEVYKKISSEYANVIDNMIHNLSTMKKQAPKQWMSFEIGAWNMHNDVLLVPDDEDEKVELIDTLTRIKNKDDYDLKVNLEKYLASILFLTD